MFVNLDAGESTSETEALWSLADVLNCACGGHAGDAHTMSRLAAFCARAHTRAVGLGAHPSYPDREHFGRRSIDMHAEALAGAIEQQCLALAHAAELHGVTVGWVKPHGALYHDASRQPAVAGAVIRGAVSALGPHVVVIGPPAGAFIHAAHEQGLSYAREGFADRRARADGSLVPRDERDALIVDPAEAARLAVALAAEVDTVCVHGDTPDALTIARAVREALHV